MKCVLVVFVTRVFIFTGIEIVDCLAAAVTKIRSDTAVGDACIHDGLVVTLFNRGGLGDAKLMSWLQHMCDINMLRLFGLYKDA